MVARAIPTVALLVPRTERRDAVQPQVDNVPEPPFPDNVGTVKPVTVSRITPPEVGDVKAPHGDAPLLDAGSQVARWLVVVPRIGLLLDVERLETGEPVVRRPEGVPRQIPRCLSSGGLDICYRATFPVPLKVSVP